MNEAEAYDWVAGRVSRETLKRLDLYANTVKKWQKAINLVGSDTLSSIFNRHIMDSLQILELSRAAPSRWVDLGSGGGFPGLVCAIVGPERFPACAFTLIESDQRKATFLSEAARITEAEATVLNARIENCPPQNADIVSARALAPLDQLCALASPHLASAGCALFLKGRNHKEEQAAADRNWKMNRELFLSKTNRDAVIYRIGELSRV
ncbi:MAG: 16S rRNA (guanine(527)-N(7))-methyltransferase RsmG [Pseudomonadota bacterium]